MQLHLSDADATFLREVRRFLEPYRELDAYLVSEASAGLADFYRALGARNWLAPGANWSVQRLPTRPEVSSVRGPKR